MMNNIEEGRGFREKKRKPNYYEEQEVEIKRKRQQLMKRKGGLKQKHQQIRSLSPLRHISIELSKQPPKSVIPNYISILLFRRLILDNKDVFAPLMRRQMT